MNHQCNRHGHHIACKIRSDGSRFVIPLVDTKGWRALYEPKNSYAHGLYTLRGSI